MDLGFYVKAIGDRKKELQGSNWLQRVLAELNRVCASTKVIRCLALGQITEFVNPRFQLALLLIIAEELHIADITAWDPAFSETDKAVLNHFKIRVEEENPPTLDNSTFYFVPHGPLSLVSSLPREIGSAVYLGNDLQKFETTDEQLIQYKRDARIVSIEPSSRDRWFPAFNATAIHVKETKGA